MSKVPLHSVEGLGEVQEGGACRVRVVPPWRAECPSAQTAFTFPHLGTVRASGASVTTTFLKLGPYAGQKPRGPARLHGYLAHKKASPPRTLQ
jgi:hypothetical protein